MSPSGAIPARAIQSTVGTDGVLRLELVERRIGPPGPGQVVVAVKAAPVHPADLLCLLAGADPATGTDGNGASLSIPLSSQAKAASAPRTGMPLGVGLEGSGLVVAANPDVGTLIGKRVTFQCAMPASFATHVTVDAASCITLPDEVTWQQGAAAFCNPLTALAMVETLRQTGQGAMVHTAAASSLGQMLVRICREDGIGLVNIVRRPEQRALLHELGAEHVCDSSSPTFLADLDTALTATQARIAFDAIGGGTLAATLVAAMETCAARRMAEFNPYGSMEAKAVCIYGRLDPSPTQIPPGAYGMVWSVEGWAMPPILARAGAERVAELKRRIVRGLTSTFATAFRTEIALADLLRPDVLRECVRKETGGKFLITPGPG